MKTVVIYRSTHHGNTKKLLDAIAAAAGDELVLTDAEKADGSELDGCTRVGLASGIYYGDFDKRVKQYAETLLPNGMPVFFLYTHGAPRGDFLKGMRAAVAARGCPELGAYGCQGFDTFGPFRLLGGIAKGHPTPEEIEGAVRFYQALGRTAE